MTDAEAIRGLYGEPELARLLTGVRDRLELDEERAAREVLLGSRGRRQREPGLAGAARAGQGDEPYVGAA